MNAYRNAPCAFCADGAADEIRRLRRRARWLAIAAATFVASTVACSVAFRVASDRLSAISVEAASRTAELAALERAAHARAAMGRWSDRPVANAPDPPSRVAAGWSLPVERAAPREHDPYVLFERAKKLEGAGVDYTLVRTSLTKTAIDLLEHQDLTSSMRIQPEGAPFVGVRVHDVSPGSVLALAGLQRGDLITAINGYSLENPENALTGYALSRTRGAALIEIVRGPSHIVGLITWPKNGP